jgi:hypothetical protein
MNTPINNRGAWIAHNAHYKLRSLHVTLQQWEPSIMSLARALYETKQITASKRDRMIAYVKLAKASIDSISRSLDSILENLGE